MGWWDLGGGGKGVIGEAGGKGMGEHGLNPIGSYCHRLGGGDWLNVMHVGGVVLGNSAKGNGVELENLAAEFS